MKPSDSLKEILPFPIGFPRIEPKIPLCWGREIKCYPKEDSLEATSSLIQAKRFTNFPNVGILWEMILQQWISYARKPLASFLHLSWPRRRLVGRSIQHESKYYCFEFEIGNKSTFKYIIQWLCILSSTVVLGLSSCRRQLTVWRYR